MITSSIKLNGLFVSHVISLPSERPRTRSAHRRACAYTPSTKSDKTQTFKAVIPDNAEYLGSQPRKIISFTSKMLVWLNYDNLIHEANDLKKKNVYNTSTIWQQQLLLPVCIILIRSSKCLIENKMLTANTIYTPGNIINVFLFVWAI